MSHAGLRKVMIAVRLGPHPKTDYSPLPRGEGGPRPAPLRAGAGRVRGQFGPKYSCQKNKILRTCIVALALIAAGCKVGPNYHRPAVTVPETYRGAAAAAPPAAVSFGDEKWWEVFQDPQLQALIRTALKQNYDVRIAATRMLEAQAQLGIARGSQLPTAGVIAAGNTQRDSKSNFFSAYETSYNELGLGFQWDLDFWGKYRRATEAARDELLATDWARQKVVGSLVANVASAYFILRAEDLQLQISQRTLTSDRDSLRLTQLLSDHGATSLLDVRQAEQLVYTASGAIPNLEKQIQQQEDLISTLLGQNPDGVTRGLELTAEPHVPEVPAGLPSSLLERRPDIRQAEAQLMAANARIGVAKAAYFPDISLTGIGGLESIPLTKLFTRQSGMWNFTGQLAQPLYAAGTLKNGVRLARAEQEQAVLGYQQTIQQAFREVSDALIAYSKDREFRIQQESLTQAARDASRLSDLRYRGGASSYLEVLDSNTRYYSAQLTLAQAQLSEMLDYVQLYRALGGGWRR
jgi:multidrug efflux system outer membrane protein